MGWRNRALASVDEALVRLQAARGHLVAGDQGDVDVWEVYKEVLGVQTSTNALLSGLLEETGVFEKKGD